MLGIILATYAVFAPATQHDFIGFDDPGEGSGGEVMNTVDVRWNTTSSPCLSR